MTNSDPQGGVLSSTLDEGTRRDRRGAQPDGLAEKIDGSKELTFDSPA